MFRTWKGTILHFKYRTREFPDFHEIRLKIPKLFVTMAPYVQDTAGDVLSTAHLQLKSVALKHDQVSKPVADDFMYDFKYNHSLPTTEVLGIEIPADCDAQKEAEGIVARLSKATFSEDAEAFAGLFLDYGETPHKQNAKFRL